MTTINSELSEEEMVNLAIDAEVAEQSRAVEAFQNIKVEEAVPIILPTAIVYNGQPITHGTNQSQSATQVVTETNMINESLMLNDPILNQFMSQSQQNSQQTHNVERDQLIEQSLDASFNIPSSDVQIVDAEQYLEYVDNPKHTVDDILHNSTDPKHTIDDAVNAVEMSRYLGREQNWNALDNTWDEYEQNREADTLTLLQEGVEDLRGEVTGDLAIQRRLLTNMYSEINILKNSLSQVIMSLFEIKNTQYHIINTMTTSITNSTANKENNTAIEENNTTIEENNTAIEENNTAIEENNTAIKENNTAIEPVTGDKK